ncbi:3-oxoacyl-[acyl-carrier-protein] synthase III C-terminal domain-containing protein [Parafrankia elaeagni]|uniref:3-oxoacyl-[acyl-carrier-protein] synthase III C-terminal domain-containing protein n=1 Tax=Parafrankia elaeagni TaxID=222534 RepID=UPI0003815A0A|nr:3-oxoacyl-[acyl-carrier-protein] synthase III C-terminal domain-containing protein [Parafrankia elaeagni]
MTGLDILAAMPLDGDRHLVRVTNDDMRTMVDQRLRPKLTDEFVELYHKLLASSRSRYFADFAVDDTHSETYQQRYERYRRRTGELAVRCVRELLDRSGVDPKKIRAVVTNTTVGGMVPNLSSIVGNSLGLHPRARIVDLGYMGCAAALLGLELAGDLLRPGELGLVVSSELTSVMANPLADTTASLVANTVFGDGVGAFLVARRPHRHTPLLRIRGHAGSVLTDDEALSTITYEPNAVYHEIRLANTIPAVAGRGVRLVMEPLVRRHLTTTAQKARYLVDRQIPQWQRNVDFAVLHTAGSKVLRELTAALALRPEQVDHNFRAFDRYGNTSSASLYYALDELLRGSGPRPGQTLLFLGYGSGFFTRGSVMEVRDPAGTRARV